MRQHVFIASLATASVVVSQPAAAHVFAGPRIFPVTLTFDDPGVADEATLPQFEYEPSSQGQHKYDFEWEYDKTITPTTALIYNQGWDILHQPGEKTHTGFENVFLTGKWQAYTNADHEFVASLGIIREFNGGYSTVQVGGDAYGSTAPTIYFGKGLGDLPIDMLRPLAVTGEASYIIPDRRLNSTEDNSGSPQAWSAGFSVQYSIPYLQTQVKDYGLPVFIGRMIPLVETTWYSPASSPASGFPATLTVAPGVIYMANTYQVGLELLIPANKATGQHVGFLAQLHFFLDDMFPRSIIGRPLFQ